MGKYENSLVGTLYKYKNINKQIFMSYSATSLLATVCQYRLIPNEPIRKQADIKLINSFTSLQRDVMR